MESGFIKYMNRSLRLVRLFGIYPLYHTHGLTRLSPGVMLYNVVLSIHFVIGSIHWVRKLSSVSLNNAVIASCVAIIPVMAILITILFFKGCKKIGKMFCMIEATEARLSLLEIYCTYGQPPIFYLVISFICLLLGTIISFFAFTAEGIIIRYYYFHSELIFTFNLYGFATLLRSLEVQFSSLSNQLLRMMESNIPIKRKEQMMEDVIEIHEELCTICSEWSKFYSTLLLFTITASFIKCIALLHYLFQDIYLFEIIFHISFALLSLLMAYTICSSVAELSKKAKEFNKFLYQMMIDDKTNIIADNKKLRLHFYMKREVVFSACGLFNLDYPLVHSMVTATITYIVILIQFDQLDEYPATPSAEMGNKHYSIPSNVYNSTLDPHYK